MASSNSHLPLYVDLDGTLIKTDLLSESILLLLKRNLFYVFALAFWLLKGIPHLKLQVATRIDLPSEQLPVNKEFQSFLEEEKSRGRKLILISASNQNAVEKVSKNFNLFSEAFGSSGTTNLKSEQKLATIQSLCSGNNFVYAGNSTADIPIWKESAEAILVNCRNDLAQKVDNEKVLEFDNPTFWVKKFFEALRPHQWLKNLLVFVPLVLSHQINRIDLLLLAGIAYVSFCLCASSVYLLNDMLDLGSDRQHRTKKTRPFASGELPLIVGFLAGPSLFILGVLIALILPTSFLLILLIYGLVTTLYSLYLKQLFIIDVVTLAALYSLRIIAGAAAISVATTEWLLAFSIFLFLGLALVKRVTELLNVIADGKQEIEGRAYKQHHLTLLSRIGVTSSVLAVVVFVLYITSPETTELYSFPLVLWLICPLLMFLLIRIWRFAHLRKLEEDPVLFAFTDRIGQVIALACGLLIWVAA